MPDAPTPGWDPPSSGTVGWRPDPTGRFDERFYSGDAWTQRVRVGDAVAIDAGQSITEPDDGWRPDPTGRFEGRYHDGRRWTKRVRVGDAVATDTRGVPTGTGRTGASNRRREQRPPGWYPDPGGEAWPHWDPPREGGDKQRYWNGHGWTAKTRVGGGRRPAWFAQPFVRRTLRAALPVVAVAAVLVVVAVAMLW